MPPSAAILSQGDEIVTGQTVDTNAAWLAERLTGLGFIVTRHASVGDRLADIIELFRSSSEDVVVSTGGLGPTDDDLTAQAAAAAFEAPLQLDETALAQLEARYAAAGRRMSPTNRKQALLPTGSTRLDNARGTAPGFLVETGSGVLACMPGVPGEMKHMFSHEVEPMLRARFELQPERLVVLRTSGAGESVLQERIGTFEHPAAVLGYRTSPRENQVKLRVAESTSREEVQAMVTDLRERIGSPVFSVTGTGGPWWNGPEGDLPQVVGAYLTRAGATVATAESCTGGRIASLFTEVAGCSGWFIEGTVTYANISKMRLLGVDEAMLAEHGAVSRPVAIAMAEGARRQAETTYALSTTGIAGPGGGTPDKPVGTVHFALATPEGTLHRAARFLGDRARIQQLAAFSALDLLRRHLHD